MILAAPLAPADRWDAARERDAAGLRALVFPAVCAPRFVPEAYEDVEDKSL